MYIGEGPGEGIRSPHKRGRILERGLIRVWKQRGKDRPTTLLGEARCSIIPKKTSDPSGPFDGKTRLFELPSIGTREKRTKKQAIGRRTGVNRTADESAIKNKLSVRAGSWKQQLLYGRCCLNSSDESRVNNRSKTKNNRMNFGPDRQ